MKHVMNGFACWNTATGEFLGAGPTEDRAREFWCMTRGPTTYGPCTIAVDVKGKKARTRKRGRR